MENKEIVIHTQEGKYNITANVKLIGKDILVAIYGGEKPHIGAVAMAQPTPSLNDPNLMSATASTFVYVGHKEDVIVKKGAEILAARLNRNVVVTAGIHWDDLPQDGINTIIQNSEILVDLILKKLESTM
jgi:gallate decarboxylase subunit D